MDFLDKNKIIVCDKCDSSGKCSVCHGYKKYIKLGNYIISFNKKYNSADVFFDKISSIFRILVNIFLILILIFGLISLFYHAYILNISGSSFLFLDNWRGFYMLIFWISIIFDMFFIYNIKKSKNKIEGVVKYSFLNKDSSKDLQYKDIQSSLSNDVKGVLIKSWDIANKFNSSKLNPLHVFLALLMNKDVQLILGRLGMDKKLLKAKVKKIIKDVGDKEDIISDLDLLMFNSYLMASKNHSTYIKVSHLLPSLILANENILGVFLDEGINFDQVVNVVTWISLREKLMARHKRYKSKFILKPRTSMNRSMTAVATPYLDRFSQDMTILARRGHLSMSVAREDKIDEVYTAMKSGQKSILIVGLPGVGKDNIIEGLANRMCVEEVPEFLQDKRLVSLSLSNMISSAQGGMIEQNLIRALTEVVRAGNIILTIPDLHNIVGVSSRGTENIDLSEVLSDMISKYDLMIIGTSNPHDYQKYLENNPLSSVMLKVDIPESNFNQTVQILESKTFSVEYKYGVYFSYQAIEKIVKLTNNYIHDRFQPSKSIKILEEVAILVQKERGKKSLVGAEDVAKLISRKINMPLTHVSESESQKLMHLEDLIHKRVIGQDEAVNMVSAALRRTRAELRDESKPITNLLFLGPTGVGKTELAKTVTEIFFGNEASMIRLDMSEYQNKDSLGRLIGAEGSSSGGILTEAVRKNPFSLVLLDEIEKAHPDILNIFLQVMDDGRLTDNQGNTIDFTNCMIIATSNAASFYLQDELAKGVSLDVIKQNLMERELRDNFKPEFLNRFNGVVLFKPLNFKEIEQITVLLLNKLAQKLDEKNISFSASPEAIRELAEIGFSPQFGARPLKRAIEQKVNDALADFLLTGKINRRDKVILEKDGEIRIEKARKF